MTDDYLLRVSTGPRVEQILLESEVEDENWFAPVDATPAELDAGLEADANELLAAEIGEAVRALGIEWPTCPQHGRLMDACSSWWYCAGEPYHDVAEVGSLPEGGAATPSLR